MPANEASARKGAAPSRSASNGIREYIYVYHVKEATGEIVKVEELDEKTGQRTPVSTAAEEAPEEEGATTLSAPGDVVHQYVYHVKEATGEIVKVEELDEKTGQRTHLPMVEEAFTYEPYEHEVEAYGNDLYGWS